ncbi:hypothetical protein Vretimale_14057 [Volvox reticuliferus]|nr:hypothetical protein Vretimale_14057 [Volvox reticuliferus]
MLPVPAPAASADQHAALTTTLPTPSSQLTTSDGRWRYPVVFMTNGGGVCEERKAQELSTRLGVRVTPEQVILSHTPMRDLVAELAQRPVLVSGRGDVLNVARSYGLQRVLHTRQLGRAMPAATPFSTYPTDSEEVPAATRTVAGPAVELPDPAGAGAGAGGGEGRSAVDRASGSIPLSGFGSERLCPVRDLGLATEAHPIDTVLVMTDPDDWYRDAQLICDVLTGAGVPTRSAAGAAAVGAPHVKLVFSNPDIWRRQAYNLPEALDIHRCTDRQTRLPLPFRPALGERVS